MIVMSTVGTILCFFNLHIFMVYLNHTMKTIKHLKLDKVLILGNDTKMEIAFTKK